MGVRTLLLAFLAVSSLSACKGSTAGTSGCPAGQIACGSECIDPLTDRSHCGASGDCAGSTAGTACQPGQVCSAGTCALSCQRGLVDCGGTCVDPLSSRTFCGVDSACANGAVCGPGQVCANGACATNCPVGQLDCGGRCVDPASDRAFCGASGTCTGSAAGVTCGAGQVCSNGTCAVSCQPGLVNCSGICVDPLVDPRYCGADATCGGGATCAPGNVCDHGACELSCQAGLVNCGGRCVDPATDRSFCGADATCAGGVACPSGTVCTAGACAASCSAGQYACGGRCIDPSSDGAYCGAAPDCTGGTACGAGTVCIQGTCAGVCPPGQVACGGKCIDPLTDASYCGASGTCSGASAGMACAASYVCAGGACVCPAWLVECAGACVDPYADAQYCGASGTCTGATAGMACAAGNACVSGQCMPRRPDFEWIPTPATVPPRFQEGATTLAHILFDGTALVDTTGHTHWTRLGAPGTTVDGMWAPAQPWTGPFTAADYWIGDAATKAFLDANTAGDFLVCARFKPGEHPLGGPNKIVIANGKPEAPGTGGWALMQMHDAFCFHYHDTSATGEWMAPSLWTIDGLSLSSMEWTWQCGGRDGTTLRVERESFFGDIMPVNGQAGPLGPFQPSPDLPTIGAYADGTSALLDGGIYEIIVTSDPATRDHMRTTIARASGGVRAENDAPVPILGADGALHIGAASTVLRDPAGFVVADTQIVFGSVLGANPTITGECFGVDASALDWTAVGADMVPLQWVNGSAVANFHWFAPYPVMCMEASSNAGSGFTCGAPPVLAPGSRHTFMACFDAQDLLIQLQLYSDGATTPFATNTTTSAALFPRLDDPASTLTLLPVSTTLRVHRLFACSTASPAECR